MGGFNGAKKAPAAKDPFNIENKSKDVRNLYTSTVWKAVLCVNVVGFVVKSPIIEQRVSICFKTGWTSLLRLSRGVMHEQKMLRIWTGLFNVCCSSVSILRQSWSPIQGTGKVEWWMFQDLITKILFQKNPFVKKRGPCCGCSSEREKTRLDDALFKLCQIMILHLQGMLQKGLWREIVCRYTKSWTSQKSCWRETQTCDKYFWLYYCDDLGKCLITYYATCRRSCQF